MIQYSSLILIYIVIYISYRSSFKFKGAIILATTIPLEGREDFDILDIGKKAELKLIICLLFFTLTAFSLLYIESLRLSLGIYFLHIFLPYITIVFIIKKAIEDVRKIKKERGWNRPVSKTINIDTRLSLIGRKMALSWKYMLIPLAITLVSIIDSFYYNRFSQGLRFSFISIQVIFLILCLLLFYIYKKQPTKVYVENYDINLKVNMVKKGNSTRIIFKFSTVGSFVLAILSLWYSFNIYNFLPIYIAVFMILAFSLGMFFIINSEEDRIYKLLDREEIIADEDDQYYDVFGYKNPYDSRLFVPARIGQKMEINRGIFLGKVYIFSTYFILTIVLIGALVFTGGEIDYSLEEQGLKINANMYSQFIDFKDIESIKLLEKLPSDQVIRVNGVGLDSVSYGNFSIKGIGKVKLYYYNKTNSVIEILSKNETPIFLNLKDKESTEYLHKRIYEGWRAYEKN